MTKRFKGAFALIPTLLLAAACSDTVAPAADETTLDAAVTDDVATFVASSTGDDIDVMTLEADDVMRPGIASRGCARGGILRRFVCAARHFRGSGSFTIEREVTFFDEAGNEQDDFDPVTTEAINLMTSLEGSHENANMNASVEAQRDFTVSNLAGQETERVWNGEATTVANRVRFGDAGDRTYDLSAATTVEDVTVAVPRTDRWPLSGTITRHVLVTVTREDGSEETKERLVIIVFDGSPNPIMTVDGVEFVLDLTERKARRRHRN